MTSSSFADRPGSIWMDGELGPWSDAQLHVLNHGLHYGSGIFEGMRAYGGRIFKIHEHIQRFHESARLLGYALPFDTDQIVAASRAVIAANGQPDSYLRPVAWRGSEQMSVAAPKSRIHVAIACWPMPAYFSPTAGRAGIALTLSNWRRQAPTMAPLQAKAAGLYMTGTLAKHEAMANGFDDALMLDWQGNIAEATAANIFLVIDGALHTPVADAFLNGITRQTVISLAQDRGLEVVERRIAPREIASASEAFVTGTAVEIAPVSRIDDVAFTARSVTDDLMCAFMDAVRA